MCRAHDEQSGDYKLSWLNFQPGAAREYLGYNEGLKYQNTYLYMLEGSTP